MRTQGFSVNTGFHGMEQGSTLTIKQSTHIHGSSTWLRTKNETSKFKDDNSDSIRGFVV